MGFLDDGARLADEGIEHARRGGDPHGLAFGLVSSGMVYLFLRDVARIDQIAAETIALATEFRLPQWLGFGQELKGWATLRSGDPAEGIRLQEEGLQRLRGTGAKTHTSRMHASLAESYLLIGKPDMARTHLGAACAHRDAHGERYYAPELVRLRALLLAHEGADPEEIEACLLEAIEIARNQEAGLHALRAATSLARFRAERGRRDAARNVLAPAHAAVTGGSNSPDVAEARALLSHLHG
jgi:predicted ATPase